jgi:broad specificity phosphatase PhoE
MRRIVLVRHGQSEMNLKQAAIVGGQSNESPLTPVGVAQAKALGRHLLARHLAPHAAPALVTSSPAVRARDTARIALREAGMGAAEIRETPALLELAQGAWEGKPRGECYTPETLAAIAADPWNFAAPGGGESQRAVEERVIAHVTREVLPRLQPGGPPALLFAHGLAIKWCVRVRCFVCGLLQRVAVCGVSLTEKAQKIPTNKQQLPARRLGLRSGADVEDPIRQHRGRRSGAVRGGAGGGLALAARQRCGAFGARGRRRYVTFER